MTPINPFAELTRAAKLFALLALFVSTLSLAGCACGVLGQNRFGGSPACDRQVAAEMDAREQSALREQPALKKRADSGDVQAQAALGRFYLNGGHPLSDRAEGLAYYAKAASQGDLYAQRIFLMESYDDCRLKARKLGQSDSDGPHFAPHCSAVVLALETLAAKACVRTSLQDNSSSVQWALANLFDFGGKNDDADFWYTVAMMHCLKPSALPSSNVYDFTAAPRGENQPNQVRGAMWLGVRGRLNSPGMPPTSAEVEEKAKARLAMLQEKVTRSGIRPAMTTTLPP